RVAPRFALVRNEALHERDAHRLPPRYTILERARERCRVRELRALGQEAADLELGIDALGEPAEELQDEPVTEADGGVRLLGPERRGLRRRPAVGAERT